MLCSLRSLSAVSPSNIPAGNVVNSLMPSQSVISAVSPSNILRAGNVVNSLVPSLSVVSAVRLSNTSSGRQRGKLVAAQVEVCQCGEVIKEALGQLLNWLPRPRYVSAVRLSNMPGRQRGKLVAAQVEYVKRGEILSNMPAGRRTQLVAAQLERCQRGELSNMPAGNVSTRCCR